MTSLSCSFAAISRRNCEISKRYPGVEELFPLTFCKKDIRSDLRTIKVGQTSLQTVRDLILACNGHLRKDGGSMTISPAHRAELGICWPPWRKCAHPVHGNRKGKPYGVGAVMVQKHLEGTWKPVAFISRAFLSTEQKELLATTWACERLADYLISKTFHIETDH